MTPKEVLAFCRENNVKAVDLRFMDFIGQWAHTTVPVDKLTEAKFEDGVGFDGSSMRGWQRVDESDMLLIPQTQNCFLDPFTKLPTLNLICNIVDPITHEDYSRDPTVHRPQGRQLSQQHGRRGRGLLWFGGRVLCF